MKLLRTLILCLCLPAAGCSLLPEIQHQPTLHNPFPQLTKIAIPPFFNLSHEATLDGRKVANAYFNELQLVPGFEVVPVGVTERAMQDYGIDLRGANDARRLAQILKVDAVVIGAVTDYTPYYPPRLALQVEWYAANPGFHPIPAGYGLPWGTRGERDIPSPLVFEAELALAKAQLKTQTPPCESMAIEPLPAKTGSSDKATHAEHGPNGGKPDGQAASYESAAGAKFAGGPVRGAEEGPASWPDARGFVPLPPSGRPPACVPSDAPCCATPALTTVTIPILPKPWPVTMRSATTGGWAAGRPICNVATTSFDSAVTCTFGKCSVRGVGQAKHE